MRKIKVGDFIRTESGIIDKVRRKTKFMYQRLGDKGGVRKFENEADYYNFLIKEYCERIEYAKNIIDLIEVGDYVNGKLVRAAYLDGRTHYIKLEEEDRGHRIYNRDIKTVVTKEQFKDIEFWINN